MKDHLVLIARCKITGRVWEYWRYKDGTYKLERILSTHKEARMKENGKKY